MTIVYYLVTVGNVRQIITEKSGFCASCGNGMDVGSLAQIDDISGLIVCASCLVNNDSRVSEPVRLGTPGGSAQREFQRRRNREKRAAREQFPLRVVVVAASAVLGYIAIQVVAAIINHDVEAHGTTAPKPVLPASTAHGIGTLFAFVAAIGIARVLWGRRQSTFSWASGAKGERAVAARLARVTTKGVISLHDRRIPGSKANIDHIAVGPSGIFIIDSKVVSGRISTRATGPIFNRGRAKLFVGGRDKTRNIESMSRQVSVVKQALDNTPWATGISITPMLALVGAEVGLFERPRTVQGVWVGWPKAMERTVGRPGPLSNDAIHQVVKTIAGRFPEA